MHTTHVSSAHVSVMFPFPFPDCFVCCGVLWCCDGQSSQPWYAPDFKGAVDNKAANNVFQSNAALPPLSLSATAPSGSGFTNSIKKHTIDIIKNAAKQKTCLKCSRETFYCKHKIAPGSQTARYVGHYKTTQMQIGR